MAQSSVDLTQFNASIRQLSALSGKDLRSVMVAEAGKVIETAVRYTPKADRAKIKAQVEADTRFRFLNGKSDAGHQYTTKDGKEWFRAGSDGKWMLIQRWKVPAGVWTAYLRVLAADAADLTKTIERRVKDALARRGLTAKTWAQSARAIGAAVNVPGYVEKAKIPDGIGTGRVETTATEAAVSGENASDVLISTRTGQGIINRAIRARAKFIQTAIEKGALDSLKNRAKSFPELFKNSG